MMSSNNSAVVGVVILLVILCWIGDKTCEAFGTFGFNIHHRYSETVKDFLDVDGLPEKDTLDYYAAMAHRDQLFKARRLATTTTPSFTNLTFFGGNETYRLNSLGFLHYALVTVGTPGLTYLVALDTGSDLFWLPCDCTSCVRSLNLTSGKKLDLNIYSPNASSTSMPVPCNSPICGARRRCSISRNACAYQDVYLSSNTSSTGILVDDVLHLATDDSQQKSVNATITLGCGIIQTGDFLEGGAPNGLFGLGMDNISVPSILASKGLLANSFSMCFGPDGLGRIDFGDKGSPDQKVTPFNPQLLHPTYNITVTHISVGNTSTDLEFTAIFDSGTSFTYLNDPAYTAITKSFNSHVTDPRYQPDTKIIFDYCYKLSANQTSFEIPDMNLTMKGGNKFILQDPIVVIPRKGGYAYCLAMVKSGDVNIIGQNFMTGYRIVFDREDMILGWKESKCYDSIDNTLPIDNNNLSNNNTSSNAPSPSVLQPEATPGNTSRISPTSSPMPRQQPENNAIHLRSSNNKLLFVIFSFVFHHFFITY